MKFPTPFAALVVLATASAAAGGASAENCDPGTDIAPQDVVLTDIAFEISDLSVDSNSTLATTQLYHPEQVVPYQFRSSVYMFLEKQDGTFVNDGDCAMEWNFDAGQHTTSVSLPRKCITETGDTNTWPKTYAGNIQYWYCLGSTTSCALVDAATTGFDVTDDASLRDDHRCKRLTYDFTATISSGGLDATVDFVLNYVRDPVDTSDVNQFFDANGNAQTLDQDVIWAICDRNDLGDVDYAACFARMAVIPEPRVIDLTTATDTNQFQATFGLQGDLDRSLVTASAPLYIDVAKSSVYLFHADYVGDYSACAAGCTDATSEVGSTLSVLKYGASGDVEQFWHVALEGQTPTFDAAAGQGCDESFCTIVLVLNFRSDVGARRELRLVMDFDGEHATPSRRMLGQSATQSKVTRARAVVDSAGGDDDMPDWVFGVLGGAAGLVGLVGVGALVARRRRRSSSEGAQQEKKQRGSSSSSVSLHVANNVAEAVV